MGSSKNTGSSDEVTHEMIVDALKTAEASISASNWKNIKNDLMSLLADRQEQLEKQLKEINKGESNGTSKR